MSHFRFFSLFLLAGGLLCPLWAQSFDEGDFLDFGEAGGLVVVAGRTPEPADTVAAQVTVITAEDIAASGAASVTEALGRAVGVRFSGAMAGAGSEEISMRGFGDNAHGRVLVLVDGNRINRPDMAGTNWNAIPLSDIERIEILDGSASVQYGNHAVGGVINIITRRGGEQRTVVGASGGSFFSHGMSFFHFSPAAWGSFSLSAESAGTEGFRQRQGSMVNHIASRATIFLGDTATLSLNAFFTYLAYQLPGGLTREEFEDDPRQAMAWGSPNLDDENRERHFGGGIGLQWFAVENVEVNLPLSYRGRTIAADMAGWDWYTDTALHTLEARPQGSLTLDLAGMPLRVLGGVDLSFTRLEADTFNDPSRRTTESSSTISQWTAGPYITARFSPLPSLHLTTGARFDMTAFDAETGDLNDGGSFSAFVYEAGIAFNPVRDLRFYARYATLFRYPFTDELVSNVHFLQGGGMTFNSHLEPERGFNLEAGAAYRFGGMLDISANVFFMQLEDEIFVDPMTWAVANLDQTRRVGTNVGFNVTPVGFLSLAASYSFINAVFTGGPNNGNTIPMVPAHTFYGSLTVRLPGEVSFGPYIEYASGSYLLADIGNAGDDRLDSWFSLGARARYAVTTGEGRELAIQVDARNLLNRNFATLGVFDTFGGPALFYPASGRSVTVSLRYRF
ncbi:MAG: TonB-dependent receptor [Treponema sp.]|nr:TonB-dependent receptor [Treponema sp.]